MICAITDLSKFDNRKLPKLLKCHIYGRIPTIPLTVIFGVSYPLFRTKREEIALNKPKFGAHYC